MVAEEYPEMKEMMKRLADIRIRHAELSDSVGNMAENFW